jgi:hypothetical protein
MKSSTEPGGKKINLSNSSFFKKAVTFLSQDEIRQELQRIIDPLIQHIMKQIFPYIILTCVLFVLLLLVVLLTLGIIVFQLRGSSTPSVPKEI